MMARVVNAAYVMIESSRSIMKWTAAKVPGWLANDLSMGLRLLGDEILRRYV